MPKKLAPRINKKSHQLNYTFLDKIIKWYSKQVSEAAGARAPPLLTKV
jgi:hypothetical protein